LSSHTLRHEEEHAASRPGRSIAQTSCTLAVHDYCPVTMLRFPKLFVSAPLWCHNRLVDGSRWCLCASRWREALEAGKAPPVVLEATDAKALKYVTMEQLREHEFKG